MAVRSNIIWNNDYCCTGKTWSHKIHGIPKRTERRISYRSHDHITLASTASEAQTVWTQLLRVLVGKASMLIASHHNNDPYTPVCAWPEDCYVQWGDNGLVFTGHELGTGIETLAGALSGKKECAESAMQMLKQSYVTAFFEAFPKDPQTFIRGEGKTVEEAEQQAFEQFQKYRACPNHEFERRDYKNGAGLCKHCDLFNSKAFKPIA